MAETNVTETTTSEETKAAQETNSKEVNVKTSDSDKKYSDSDVNELIGKKFAEWQKKKDAEIDEAKKLAEMNEAQKAKYESEKLQKQINELLQKETLSNMTKTARTMLSEKGITVSDDLLSVLVSADAEKTSAAVDSFATMFESAVEKAVKEALKGNLPKAGAGKSSTLTKEQIMDIKDPIERQKLMMENKQLFGL